MLRGVARPPKEAASPSALAPALLRWVAAKGADASLLAAQIGTDDVTGASDELAVTPSGLAALLRASSELLADPHLALRLPSEVPLRRYDPVTLAARASRTPRDVLALVERYAPLVFPQLEARLVDDANAGEIRFSARVAGHARGLGHHVDEYVLAVVLGHLRRPEARVTPLRVWMTSARPPALAPLYAAVATHEITFGAEDTGIALAIDVADRELPGADPLLLATGQHLASAALASTPRAGAFAEVVAARIERILPGEVGTEALAAALHMSARTLQRRLDDEGTRFSDVLDAVRERIARRLVRDRTIALTEVGYRVGFSDAATFSRAFKRWTGMPPGAFRRRQT
ncbi:MAG: Transcriptional regulator, AraC family [Labilithrix sp.]|nr:Transcriptional regulator, AraC family [Labilithrix sp.]